MLLPKHDLRSVTRFCKKKGVILLFVCPKDEQNVQRKLLNDGYVQEWFTRRKFNDWLPISTLKVDKNDTLTLQ